MPAIAPRAELQRIRSRAHRLPQTVEDLIGEGRIYIRKTPNPRSSNGAFSAADKASPSTRRVSAGSMIPSSHKPRCGIVRRAFMLIEVADRRLERLFLIR